MPFRQTAAATETDAPQRGLLLPVLFIGGLVVALATAVVVRDFQVQRQSAMAELQAVADLRQTQVEGWLRERLSLARFLSSSSVFASQYLAWKEGRDPTALPKLMARVIELRVSNGSDEVILLDDRGEVVARELAGQPTFATQTRDAALRAMASGEVTHTGIYRRDGATTPLRLDIVLPLTATGSPARAALVLRQNPQRELFPLLRAWPVPNDSGESVLWRRQGDALLALSELRFSPDAAARLTRTLVDVPSAPASDPGLRQAPPHAGVDYRGEPVFAATRRIDGTDWLLVTKIDRREVDEPAWSTLRWAASLVLAALLALAAGARLLVQRAALRSSVRERAEQRQRLQTLQLLQAITDNTGDAIFAKDLQGRYLLFNRAAARDLGRSADEVLGRTDDDLFNPEVAAALGGNDQQVLQRQATITFEEVLPTARGERTSLTTKGPLRDGDGKVIGVFGVARDVTESRRAEQALRESEAHYRSVFSVLGEGLLVFDREGLLLSANPAAARILQLPPSAMQGHWSGIAGWRAVDAGGQPLAPERLPAALVMATGQAQHNVEIEALDPQDQRHWLNVSAQPVPGADGSPMAVVVSIADITEERGLLRELEAHRHHLQRLVDERTEALQLSHSQLAGTERFLRQLADSLPVRIAYWDPEIRCRFANRAFYEWFGLTPEQVIGRTGAEIHASDYLVRAQPRLQAALDGEPQLFERETLRPDGRRYHHQMHYLPDHDAEGRVQGVYVLGLDISALKRAEAGLQTLNAELVLSRDRAEAANRAKSVFLANMSHEIRTPMNAIIGLAHLMQRDAIDGVQRDRLHKVSDSARHLLQIINDILDLSKIEAGRLALEDIEFSLDTLLARAFEMVADAARRKGLEMIVDTDHLPDRLRGDPTRLSQALLNLLSNAVKFTERGWVRLSCEMLAGDDERLQARFEVSDTGAGIPPDRLGALFNAFEQVDSSTSRRHGGTGLGLALTRRLATMMGGEAGAESQLGQGSRFWFTATLGRGTTLPASGPGLAGRRVLLVDDLAEARSALGDRLREFSMRVDAVESGERALTLAQQGMEAGEAYDLLLIDWRMAPLDGLQTLQRLRLLLGAGLPPALLVTAYDDAGMRREAQAVGFAEVLVKPITASTLHDALQRALQHQLPTPAPATLPGRAELALRRAGVGRHVLLAEDNPVNQEVAVELLRSAGLRCDVADNGEQAVQMALATPYDAIVMDMQMPVVDGLEATRRLRSHGLQLPIIAMTANAFGEDRAACLAAGMNDHVAKPVDPEQLYQTLLRWLPPADAEPGGAAGDPVDAALLARLQALPGLDTALALRQVGGRTATLLRLLRRFADHYRDGLPALLQPAGAEQLAAWRIAAHSLQGASGAVGAVELHTLARTLEHRLRNADPAADASPPLAALHAEAQQLHEALLAFVARLDAALQ